MNDFNKINSGLPSFQKYNSSKIFIIKKTEMGKTIRSTLRKNFESSSEYFKEIPNVVIGKISNGPRESKENNKILDYSVVGGNTILKELEKTKNKLSKKASDKKLTLRDSNKTISKDQFKDSKTISSLNNIAQTSINNANKNFFYEPIDDKSLANLYDKLRERVVKNQNKELLKSNLSINKKTFNNKSTIPTNDTYDNFYNEEIPNKDINRLLNKQKKVLENFTENNLKTSQIENYIVKKFKKNPLNLLTKSSDSYLIKKEIINLADSKISDEEKKGIYNWIISLRRPKNFIGKREALINYGSQHNSNWHHYLETSPNIVEKVINPNFSNYKSLEMSLDNSCYLNLLTEISSLDQNKVSL